MIKRKVFGSFTWIDVSDPTESEKQEVVEKYGFTVETLNDLLNSKSIPLGTYHNDRMLLILRFADENSFLEETADTVEELTHRLAMICGSDFILTLHRNDYVPYSQDYDPADLTMEPKDKLFLYILNSVLKSFEPAIYHADDLFEDLELSVLENRTSKTTIQSIYFLKRKAAVLRRIIAQTLELLKWYLSEKNFSERKKLRIQRLVGEVEKQKAKADELVEDSIHLLQSYVAISSHQTNDIMRVLTIFSVFFMPLTFIVGVYGMNFKNMPEIEWKYGYQVTWVLILVTCGVLFAWFRAKGWILQSRRARKK